MPCDFREPALSLLGMCNNLEAFDHVHRGVNRITESGRPHAIEQRETDWHIRDCSPIRGLLIILPIGIYGTSFQRAICSSRQTVFSRAASITRDISGRGSMPGWWTSGDGNRIAARGLRHALASADQGVDHLQSYRQLAGSAAAPRNGDVLPTNTWSKGGSTIGSVRAAARLC